MSSKAYFISTDPQVIDRIAEIEAAHEERRTGLLKLLAEFGYNEAHAEHDLRSVGPFRRRCAIQPEAGEAQKYAARESAKRVRAAEIKRDDKAHLLVRLDNVEVDGVIEWHEVVKHRGNTNEGKALAKRWSDAFETLPPGLLNHLEGRHVWSYPHALLSAMGYGAIGRIESQEGRRITFGRLIGSRRPDVMAAVMILPYTGVGESLCPFPGWGEEVTERTALRQLEQMGYRIED